MHVLQLSCKHSIQVVRTSATKIIILAHFPFRPSKRKLIGDNRAHASPRPDQTEGVTRQGMEQLLNYFNELVNSPELNILT